MKELLTIDSGLHMLAPSLETACACVPGRQLEEGLLPQKAAGAEGG